MSIKILIILLLAGVIASLFTGFGFLLKDVSTEGSKRTLYALGIRITLAAALLITIAYGIQSGQLKNNAPWDNPTPANTEQTKGASNEAPSSNPTN